MYVAAWIRAVIAQHVSNGRVKTASDSAEGRNRIKMRASLTLIRPRMERAF